MALLPKQRQELLEVQIEAERAACCVKVRTVDEECETLAR
jgi:hypothetical protein